MPDRAAHHCLRLVLLPALAQGQLPVAAADLVSPIFTMWLTLLLLYLSNCLADYSAAATLNAAYTEDLRQSEGEGERGVEAAGGSAVS